MNRWVFRVFLLLAGLVYLAAVAVSGIGFWSLEHPSTENLRRGIRWDEGNAMLWRYYARSKLLSLADAELREGAEAYRQALARNPLDPLAWEGLATIDSRLGDSRVQEAALRGWIAAMPHSPDAAWALANFLLVEDRTGEALPLLRTAATSDPALRWAVYELGWKLLGDPQRILEELVPTEIDARMYYLFFLVARKGRLKESYPIWQTILPERSAKVLEQGQWYVEQLAAAGFGEEAARVWKEIGGPGQGSSLAPVGESITNGDFEVPVRNGGLDWRMTQGVGYQIALDNFVYQSGTRSLRIRFDGKTNPEFAAVAQWVAVEPGKSYHFQVYLKTENITTDNGMFVFLTPQGVPPAESWMRTTENRVGSADWTKQELDFQTGPHTRVILIQLRRQRSTKLNNLLQGTVWMDHVSLQPQSN